MKVSIPPRANFSYAIFLLTGFPGLEWAHHWISLPIFMGYFVAIMGNATILHLVRTDPSLHQPMYYFLAILAVTDLGLCMSTLPSVLGVLWFDARMVGLVPCVLQQHFLHSFSFMESAVLFAMALDRLIAIRFPLRYASVLTGPRVALIGTVLGMRSAAITAAPSLHLLTFDYCHPGALSHAYCLHQDMIRLACSDTRFNRLYGLCIIMLAMGSDVLFILLSYAVILRTVLAIASAGERLKALNTCVSHILAVLCFYVPVLGLSIVHRFGQHTSPLVHILMGTVSVLFPPVMNPVIYSIKTQQIRRAIVKVISLGKIQ
ncbi:olfactory receptor family 51 subfamily AI member 2 [Mus musculus]|jgi:olfactory receptor|uniref:Mor 5'Beta5 n=1 Tax=Mus musculus TaxID=10090 RepID=Q9EPN9_MOUSE|nr:olfactory receptor family 51 subfamily AI member 2 [Mus musculus]AAG41688.1 Mor 5'Beta5 [Mus musculus]AAL60630.1 olfactory receptor MOR2-1 [Mus musculus]AAP71110.1 olfactory receptor Olfr632 [Mus musculus]EDL16697.1 olfactory receptor 632 [Mus musculus]|eukprot:NP_667330.1 olfactory receptor 632 [Mus musculus]